MPRAKDEIALLGERLRLARIRREMTMADMGERAGITRQTLAAVESGASSASMGAYVSVLFCLGLDHHISLLAAEDPLGRELEDVKKKRVKRVHSNKQKMTKNV